MSYTSLANFLEELERLGELRSIDDADGTFGRSAEISLAMAQDGRPALLIRNIRGIHIPLSAGLLATPGRITCALEVGAIEEVSERLAHALSLLPVHELRATSHQQKPSPDREGGDLDVAALLDRALARFKPRAAKSGACQKVVRLGCDVDLERLPLADGWPEETHRLLTAGQLVSRDPVSGRLVVGHAELSVRSACELAVHWTAQEPLAKLFEVYRERGQTMPLAVALGGHPASLLAAMAPLPAPVDRGTLAGLLAGKPIEVVRCRTVELDIPAEAEFVLEGSVDPTLPDIETGPVATPLGHYARSRPAQTMRVSALTHRANPVFPTIVHGPDSRGWVAINRAMHRVLLPLLRLVVPELVDINLPQCGHGRELAWVAIRKTDEAAAERVARALWNLPATRFCKLTVIVDEDIDVHNAPSIWSALAKNMDPRKDTYFDNGPADPWDATDNDKPCRRMALDATTRLTNSK